MPLLGFKARFVPNIERGLTSAYSDQDGVHPKRQTIRRGTLSRDRKQMFGKSAKVRVRVSDKLILATGERTKHYRKIGEARCVSLKPVVIWINEHALYVHLDGNPLFPGEIAELARNDGFKDWQDMWSFFRKEHGDAKFEGVLIEWKPL